MPQTPITKVALITGCSSGIGLHTAIAFAKAGFFVYATMRNLSKSSELLEAATEHRVLESIKPFVLDVTDQDSITACFEDIVHAHGRIDVVVNNAGYSEYGPIEALSIEQIHKQFDTNVYGCVRVMKAALPLMRAQQSGLVITVSSIGGISAMPFSDAYIGSKFAIEGIVEAMAPVYKKIGIDLCLVEPGPVVTNFFENINREAMPRVPKEIAPMAEKVTASFVGLLKIAQTSEEIARVILGIEQDSERKLRYLTSEDFKPFVSVKSHDFDGMKIMTKVTERFLTSGEDEQIE